MDYLFGENEVLKGNMRLNSKLLDVNEWMEQADEAPDEVSSDSVRMEIPEIPNNIDFEFRSNIEQINYDNLTLKKVHGVMIIREGKLILKPLSFETLGGNITMDGQYDTRDPESVLFTYSLNMKGISLPGAYTSFKTVKTFAPMAKAMNGNFSSDFSIDGIMKKDLTPVYQSINGNGSIEIKEAMVKSSKVIKALNALTGMNISSENLALNDIKILANMENGRAYVRPFSIHAGGHDLRISGSIGADGSLDYILDTEIEAGEKGQQINALLASLSGKEADSTDTTVKIKINVSGTYENPKLTLAGITSADGRSKLQSDVKKEITSQTEQVKVEAESQIMEGIGHVLEGDTAALEEQADSLKNILNSDILDNLGQKGENIKNSLQNLFKKKKKDDN
jgi:hypothetical protein